MHETFCETLLRAYYELLVVIAIRAVAAVSVIRDKLGVLAGRIVIVCCIRHVVVAYSVDLGGSIKARYGQVRKRITYEGCKWQCPVAAA